MFARIFTPFAKGLPRGIHTRSGARLPSRVLTAVLFLALAGPPLLAQDEALRQRVGISGASIQLSLSEAIRLALESNPTIRIAGAEVDGKRFALTSRKGVFDPSFQTSSEIRSETVPVGSILAGGESGTLSTDTWTNTASLSQRLPFGGNWSLSLDAERSTTSNLFAQLDPQYPTFLGVDFTFPLLKNRSIDDRRLQVVIASRDIEVAEADFARMALDLVTNVRTAYWNLIFARENERVMSEAVRLAAEQVDLNRRLLAAGQMGEVDVVESEAARQKRQEEWLASIEEITARENDLKRLILGSRSADYWQRELVPVDQVENVDSDLSVSAAWQVASTHRPALKRLEAQAAAQRANSDYLENQTKPALDLIASYGMNGLAGQERSGDNPFSGQNAQLRDRVNELSGIHDLELLPPTTPGGIPQRLLGGWGRSFSNLFSNDFRSGSIGVTLEFPFGNREIKGQLGVSRIRQQQLEFQRADTEQQIESEIRNALQEVQTTKQRVEAAAAARSAALSRLQSEQRLFAAGETTNFLLLVRQTDYTEASGTEVRAKMDLNIALARLQRVLGTALDAFGIQLDK